jgi:hypothetical protein
MKDSGKPVLTLSPSGAAVTAEFGEPLPDPPTATTSDSCDREVQVNMAETLTPPETCQDKVKYTVTHTWTAKDSCGNEAESKVQEITVKDPTTPALTKPDDEEVECHKHVPDVPIVTGNDKCNVSVPVVQKEDEILKAPGAFDDEYTLVRMWTATNAFGNITAVSQTIEAEDGMPPFDEPMPAAKTKECYGVPGAGEPPAKDNWVRPVTVTFDGETKTPTADGGCDEESGNILYTLTRKWTATDSCGHKSQVSKTIAVTDKGAPYSRCRPGTLQRNAGRCWIQPVRRSRTAATRIRMSPIRNQPPSLRKLVPTKVTFSRIE